MRHRSSTPILHAAWTAAAMFLVRASLLANCGSAMCPMDPQSLNVPLPRQFTLDFSFQYIDQDQVRIGTHKGFVGEVPSTHDEIRTVNRGIGFLANYAISYVNGTLTVNRAARKKESRCHLSGHTMPLAIAAAIGRLPRHDYAHEPAEEK